MSLKKNIINTIRRVSTAPETNPTAINSFNANHSLYDKLRPTYQESIVKAFLNELAITPQSKILELAAGTGKFTRKLTENGFKEIEVVEPSKGMLESFTKLFPEIKTHLGSSYDIPLSDKSVDCIIVAQGFHWFADEKSLKEMRRVLKDNGKVGCIWNFDGESVSQKPLPNEEVQIVGELEFEGDNAYEILKKVFLSIPWNKNVVEYAYSFDANVPQYRSGVWKSVLENNAYFKPLRKELYSYYKLPVKYDDVFKYWATRSYITDLPDEEQKDVQKRIEEILEENVNPGDKIDVNGEVYLEKYMGCHAVVVEPL